MIMNASDEPANGYGLCKKPSKPLNTRKFSKRIQFLPRLGSKEKVTVYQMTDAMEKLYLLTADRTKRGVLIQKLLIVKMDACVKVRFLCAVEEYEQIKNKTEKKSKGRKIVAM
jgi:hypothetical protein